jgi:hypothetical protein
MCWSRSACAACSRLRADAALAAVLKISVEELADFLAAPPVVQLPSAPEPADQTAHGAATTVAGADDLDVVRSFRVADRQVGGAHLYAAVTSYLQRTVAPRVFGQTLDRDGERVFAAAASLTEMAGWMAHDCGHDRLAQQHFERASSMAMAERDHQLAAHIFGSLSHLSHHLRRPKAAIAYARQGNEQLRRRVPGCRHRPMPAPDRAARRCADASGAGDQRSAAGSGT